MQFSIICILVPVFVIEYRHHGFYVGPQYSIIYGKSSNWGVKIGQNSFGVNFGYRYYSKELNKQFKIFGQFNYSIYQINYTEYQLGPHQKSHNDFFVENTLSVGVDCRIYKGLNIFSGIGVGANYFFLGRDRFRVNTYLGIEYKF